MKQLVMVMPPTEPFLDELGADMVVEPGPPPSGGQTPPLPAWEWPRRRGLGDTERGAGSCGLFDCWTWPLVGTGAGLVAGLVAVAVIRAVIRKRGGG